MISEEQTGEGGAAERVAGTGRVDDGGAVGGEVGPVVALEHRHSVGAAGHEPQAAGRRVRIGREQDVGFGPVAERQVGRLEAAAEYSPGSRVVLRSGRWRP